MRGGGVFSKILAQKQGGGIYQGGGGGGVFSKILVQKLGGVFLFSAPGAPILFLFV